jgi:hypothetical protein
VTLRLYNRKAIEARKVLADSISCYLRYLPATLSAKDGSMIKTQVISNLIINWLTGALSFCPPNKTKQRPTIPKAIEAQMKMRVEIFCMNDYFNG